MSLENHVGLTAEQSRDTGSSTKASPLDAIVHEAGRKLLTLRMTKIVGMPDRADVDNLNADLDVLCDIIDPVILAIGRYAQEHLGFSQKEIKEYFTDQLRGALDGNATFILTEALAERDRQIADDGLHGRLG